MRALLDTQVFLWALSEERKLSPLARELFTSPENEIILSVASVWEIMVKVQRGKLPFPKPAATYLRRQVQKTAVELLAISLAHVLRIEKLPMHHRDPFDRILVAQALEERIPLISADHALRAYPAEILW